MPPFAPSPVGMYAQAPLQPAYVAMQTYMPANSMTYPNAMVPVVGITPSQMVANVFCSATSSSSGAAVGPKTGAPSAFSSLAGSFASPTFCTVNGLAHNSLPTATTATTTTTGVATGGSTHISAMSSASSNSWPMESQNPGQSSGDTQEAEGFEAKWAALESKSQPRAANPFSNDLQKTFEIEL